MKITKSIPFTTPVHTTAKAQHQVIFDYIFAESSTSRAGLTIQLGWLIPPRLYLLNWIPVTNHWNRYSQNLIGIWYPILKWIKKCSFGRMSHLSCSISPALLVELSAKDVIGKTMMTSSSSSVYWCRERNKFLFLPYKLLHSSYAPFSSFVAEPLEPGTGGWLPPTF